MPTLERLDTAVFTIDHLLSPAECTGLIDAAEGLGFASAPITTGLGFVHLPEMRNNTRVMFDDVALAGRLWERLAPFVPAEQRGWRVLGLNERFRIYRYDPGQYFRWHHDGCFERSPVERSFLTAMVYLNQDFVGGQTEFQRWDGPDLAVEPATGKALVFDHPLRHQGSELIAGRKYALRTDVMYRRGR